jgi:hypothetical protein
VVEDLEETRPLGALGGLEGGVREGVGEVWVGGGEIGEAETRGSEFGMGGMGRAGREKAEILWALWLFVRKGGENWDEQLAASCRLRL